MLTAKNVNGLKMSAGKNVNGLKILTGCKPNWLKIATGWKYQQAANINGLQSQRAKNIHVIKIGTGCKVIMLTAKNVNGLKMSTGWKCQQAENVNSVRHLFLFLFLSRRKSRQVETFSAPCPFTWHRWRFSAHPFLLFLCLPTPSNCEAYRISPRFRQSGPSSPWSWSVSSFVFFVILFLVAASCRIFVLCVIFIASRIWSHRV